MVGTPPGSQASIGDHRYWLLDQVPNGLPRTIRCAVDRRNSTRVDMPIVPAQVLPSPTAIWWASAGIARDSSAPVASFRATNSAIVSASTAASQVAPSAAMPCSSSSFTTRRRSPGTRASVTAACTTGTRSRGTTNMVRRMHSVRTRVRSA